MFLYCKVDRSSKFFTKYHPHWTAAVVERAYCHDDLEVMDLSTSDNERFLEIGSAFLLCKEVPVVISDSIFFQELIYAQIPVQFMKTSRVCEAVDPSWYP